MRSINSIIKANKFLKRLNNSSLSDLSELSLRELVSIYYLKIQTRNGSCIIEEAPIENVYRVAEKLCETAKKLIKKDVRQLLYQNLTKLNNKLRLILGLDKKYEPHKDKLIHDMEILEERICIQFEACNIKDKELDEYYLALKSLKQRFLNSVHTQSKYNN